MTSPHPYETPLFHLHLSHELLSPLQGGTAQHEPHHTLGESEVSRVPQGMLCWMQKTSWYFLLPNKTCCALAWPGHLECPDRGGRARQGPLPRAGPGLSIVLTPQSGLVRTESPSRQVGRGRIQGTLGGPPSTSGTHCCPQTWLSTTWESNPIRIAQATSCLKDVWRGLVFSYKAPFLASFMIPGPACM